MTERQPAMTDTGGLFCAHSFGQIIQSAIKPTASPNFRKLGLFSPYLIPNHTQTAKRAYNAIKPYFRHDRRG